MAKKKSALLELSTDIERDYVLIDKQVCTIKNKQELSIVDLYWVQRRFKGIHKLFTQDDLGDEELTTLQGTVDEFVNFIFVDTPQELIDKLTEGQKMEIVTVFTNLFLESQPERVKKEIEKLTAEMESKETTGTLSETPSQ